MFSKPDLFKVCEKCNTIEVASVTKCRKCKGKGFNHSTLAVMSEVSKRCDEAKHGDVNIDVKGLAHLLKKRGVNV